MTAPGTDRAQSPAARATVVGLVTAVQVFPLKSADAGPARSIRLDAHGVVGDRRYAVAEADGRVLTAAEAPRLREVVAWLGPDGSPRVATSAAAEGLHGQSADHALSALLGREVRLVPVDPGSQREAPVHLVSVQAIEAAARGEHDGDGCACSTSDPRANLVMDLRQAGEREHAWVGRLLRVGPVLLRLHRRPGHCLGIYAEVAVGGQVQAGDLVTLLSEGIDGRAPAGAPAGASSSGAGPAGDARSTGGSAETGATGG